MTAPATLDLGALDGPVLCFGGPYGNSQATEALLAQARRLGVPGANILCTGDVVAYCADPAATVALIRHAGVHVLMGNCEEALGLARGDCGCGFAPDSPCDVLSREWFAHAQRELAAEAKAWMAALPRRIRFVLSGRRFAVIHGGAADIGRFIFASTPARDKEREFDLLDAEAPGQPSVEAVIAGHCGLPFSELIGAKLWHNPGVIGMPANDGRTETWFSLLMPRAHNGIEIRHLPLAYDHQAAARRMGEIALGPAYARALVSGLWPDMGVLPETERAGRQKPLRPWRFAWEATKVRAA